MPCTSWQDTLPTSALQGTHNYSHCTHLYPQLSPYLKKKGFSPLSFYRALIQPLPQLRAMSIQAAVLPAPSAGISPYLLPVFPSEVRFASLSSPSNTQNPWARWQGCSDDLTPSPCKESKSLGSSLCGESLWDAVFNPCCLCPITPPQEWIISMSLECICVLRKAQLTAEGSDARP